MTSLFASKAVDVIRILLIGYPREWALRDLLNYPARGEEAAGEIYKLIEKRWKEAEPI